MLLVLAMSIGQGIALFSLVLYLLAVALDLQSSGGAYIAAEEPSTYEAPPPAAGSEPPPA
jgi:hypothetical protein